MTLSPAGFPDSVDEMVNGQGGFRPHWRSLLTTFAGLGEGGLMEQMRRLDRAFEDEGVTSILPGAGARAWRCDPVPLPITAEEFATLETGLGQRAELLEAVLQDIYGPQTLLAENVLPPALVVANSAFLRPCCVAGPAPWTRRFLDFYAADLIRGPDGAWRVLADRTGNAAGIAYARENRRTLARVLPEAFRGVHVRPLRPFFDIWQNALQRLGQDGGSRISPGIALLTPGTGSRHWFEHMMLSRELSCALVEGGDLSVRAGGVFLKTLKGLQPVDVLLRRLDGNMLDPLELDSASLIGVPGLMDAARAGTVRITNDPGSGAAEAPALAAWLGPMCLRLLGEPLKLASVPTMWLGDSRAEELVRRNPERWLIRPATDGRGAGAMPARLSPRERATLLEAIAAAPWRYAATAALAPSVAPCAGPAGLVPRPVVLRLYLVFDGQSWRAMEGGLARVLEDDEPISGALPGEGLSKDVWVLYQERTDIVGPSIVSVPPLAIRRAAGELPSRVADDLFWLGRYVERLEGWARLVRATIARLSRSALAPHEMLELMALSYSLEHTGAIPPETVGAGGGGNALSEALFASLREGGAIAGLFGDVARLTELVRDRLTGDMYAAFTAALRQTRTDAARVNRDLDALSHAMVGILRFSASVAGLAAENMVRGGGWLFLELGRRIERAQAVAAQVGFALDQPPPRIEAVLRLILELCDSVITYRTRYLTVLQPAPVLDLVLADDSNPRGLAFQLASVARLLDDIAGHQDGFMSGAAAALCAETQAMVTRVVDAPDQAVAAADLPVRLAAIETAVAALSDRVSRHYFALLPVAQTLGLGGEDIDLRGAAA